MGTPHRLVAAAAAVLASPLFAQGPDPALIPADAGFVAHVDLRGLARVLDLERLLEQARGGQGPLGRDGREALAILDRVEAELNFELLRDLHSVTVFGTDPEQRDPTVLLMASARVDGVLDRLEEAGVAEIVRRDGLRFHRLSLGALAGLVGGEEADVEEADADEAGWLYVREVDSRRAILIGASAGGLSDAARVLAGTADSAARGEGRVLRQRPSRDAIVYVELGGPFERLTRRTPASRIGERVHRLSAELAERDGEAVLEVAARTESDQDAQNVAAIVNGLRGLLALTDAAEEVPGEVRDALEDARAEADGTRVSVRLSMSLDTVRGLVQERTRRRAND